VLGRLALSKREAADALGVSVDFFEKHIMPELRIIRRGRRRLIPVREVERWLDENAAVVLERDQRALGESRSSRFRRV
jgi:excisionase family DNA binding protein